MKVSIFESFYGKILKSPETVYSMNGIWMWFRGSSGFSLANEGAGVQWVLTRSGGVLN